MLSCIVPLKMATVLVLTLLNVKTAAIMGLKDTSARLRGVVAMTTELKVYLGASRVKRISVSDNYFLRVLLVSITY